MLLSIFTPTHRADHLSDAYQSLRAQTYANWEWILVLNGGVSRSQLREEIPAVFGDRRVRVIDTLEGIEFKRVGALKRLACKQATGEVLIELDHDDMLLPNALAAIANAFQDPSVTFVYSNTAAVREDWSPYTFDTDYGWQYRVAVAFGHQVQECLQPAPIPQNLSRILFAPDHVRAWRAEAYWLCGGHDEQLALGDDHDLICRSYLTGKFVHIDQLLYVQRIHGRNTWLASANTIQEQSWANYERYKERLALRWAEDNGLVALDLCGGIDSPECYTSVDLQNADVTCDLNGEWPFADNSVGVIRACDALEHLADPVHVFSEIYRVLSHGGFLFSATPSTDGPGAWCDPTHISFFNSLSFRYYTQANFRRYHEPRAAYRFQEVRVQTIPGDIPYVQADLLAIKGGERFHGLQLI